MAILSIEELYYRMGIMGHIYGFMVVYNYHLENIIRGKDESLPLYI